MGGEGRGVEDGAVVRVGDGGGADEVDVPCVNCVADLAREVEEVDAGCGLAGLLLFLWARGCAAGYDGAQALLDVLESGGERAGVEVAFVDQVEVGGGALAAGYLGSMLVRHGCGGFEARC